jgi:anaerobic selenocysteine-containing dehydrogenase
MITATDTTVRSQCPYCGVGCGIQLTVRNNQIVRVQGDDRHPANYGKLCVKGATLDRVLATPNRLTRAYLRQKGDADMLETELDLALRNAADRLRAIVERDGPDALAFYISGQLTTEADYLINKLCKGLIGTNNIDANSRLCMASAVAGYTQAFGTDGPPCSYADIEQADCFVLIGSNAAECHPVTYRRIERQVRQRGAKLIVIDPRRTATARHADLHLPIRPGGDTALLNGILHILIRDGCIDRAYIERHTSGWQALAEAVREYAPDAVAQVTGLSVADIEQAAALFGKSERVLSLWSMGVNQSRNGVAKALGIINLHLATGKIGKPGCGPFSLTGQPNAMGGREAGYLAHQLPGYRLVANPRHRAEVEAAWGLAAGAIQSRPGKAATEIFGGLADGTIKAIWIIGTNPMFSMPNLDLVRRALDRAELVIVQDAYNNAETLRFADIALPAAQWAEQDGSFTASDRHTTLLNKAVDPPGDALPDWRLVQAVAQHMGYGEKLPYQSAAEIYDELRHLTEGGYPLDISGISHARLRDGPIQWPCPDESHPGTPRLYADGRFATPDGRARFHLAQFAPPGELPDVIYPFWLTTGRVLEQWHSRTRTGQVAKLNQKESGSYIEIHPDDAAQLGIADGQQVNLLSRRGGCTAVARLSLDIARGVLFMPIHWQDGNPNWATSPILDPTSKQPELKACAVWLARIDDMLELGATLETGERVRTNTITEPFGGRPIHTFKI